MTSEVLDQYQILRGTAEIMRKNRLLKHHPGERSIRLCACSLGVVALSVLGVLVAPTHAQSSRIECGATQEASLELDQSWERVSVEHPSALCAFRSKGTGFPSATVTWEVRSAVAVGNSPSARAEAIVQSYQRVGLTDARLFESTIGTSPTLSRLSAVVSYTNLNTPMTAIIVVIDGAWRTFTLTLLDTTDSFAASRPVLDMVAQSFQISDPIQRAGREQLNPVMLAGVVLVGMTGVALFVWLTKRVLRG